MKVSLIKIGNSQGIRIPKTVIEQCGFGKEVEMRIEGDALTLRPARPPRSGWEEAFARAEPKADELLPDYLSQEWDEAEWTW